MATAPTDPIDRVMISDLPDGMGEAGVRTIFGAYGNIKSVRMAGRNATIITFQTVEEAKWIVENLDGNIAQDMTEPVSCKYAPIIQNTFLKGGGKSARAEPYSGGAGKGGGASKGGGAAGGGGKPWGGSEVEAAPGGGCSIQILKKGLACANVLPGGKWVNDENALCVSGLPSDTTDLDLYEIFSPFGSISWKGVRAMTNADGTCMGYGFVNFQNQKAVQLAIETLHGTIMPQGTTLRVRVMGKKGGTGGKAAPKAEGKGA